MQSSSIQRFAYARFVAIVLSIAVGGCSGDTEPESDASILDGGQDRDSGDDADAGGALSIRVDTVLCEDVSMTIVAPRLVEVDTPTQIVGSASNPSGDEFSVQWSSSAGNFDDRSAAQTMFTCTETGTQTVTMFVANESEKRCSDALAVAILCKTK